MTPELFGLVLFALFSAGLAIAWVMSNVQLAKEKDWHRHYKDMYHSEQRITEKLRETNRSLELEHTRLNSRCNHLESDKDNRDRRLTDIMAAAAGVPVVDNRDTQMAALKAAKQSINAAMETIDNAVV